MSASHKRCSSDEPTRLVVVSVDCTVIASKGIHMLTQCAPPALLLRRQSRVIGSMVRKCCSLSLYGMITARRCALLAPSREGSSRSCDPLHCCSMQRLHRLVTNVSNPPTIQAKSKATRKVSSLRWPLVLAERGRCLEPGPGSIQRLWVRQARLHKQQQQRARVGANPSTYVWSWMNSGDSQMVRRAWKWTWDFYITGGVSGLELLNGH